MESVVVPLPYGRTELCPVRALNAWLAAAGITDGPVFPRLWLPARGGGRGRGKQRSRGEMPASGGPTGQSSEHAPPLPQIGKAALRRARSPTSSRRAVAAGFARRDLAGHSLKRGALTTGMDRGIHPAKLKRVGRHKSFDVLCEYLEFGDLFDGNPLTGVL
jgi:hypothetical protein